MKPFKALCFAASLLLFGQGAQAATPTPMVQVNLSGAEFGGDKLPGKANYDYVFPSATALSTWKSKGVTVIRVPVLWERLQPKLSSPLDATHAKEIDQVLKLAAARGMSVILDVHNYGKYHGNIIGSSSVPYTAYGNLMWRMADRWKGNAGLNGYDIMNEPNGDFDANWQTAAQTAITQIRRYDTVKPIYVEGKSWSGARQWPDVNGSLLLLRDPSNNLIFSAHLYIDSDASGTYPIAPAADFDLDIGVKRATPFVEWLTRNNRRGHIGEFGIPGDDPRWGQAMDRLLAYLKTHCVPLTYWAAGPWWGTYKLSIEPQVGVVSPQWTVLSKYVQTQNCP
jgi:endoglucanase